MSEPLVQVTVKNKVGYITMNRLHTACFFFSLPNQHSWKNKKQKTRAKRYNALNLEMYEGIGNAFKNLDSDPNVAVICLTGKGKYFSSGNDLSNFKTKETLRDLAHKSAKYLTEFRWTCFCFANPVSMCADFLHFVYVFL